MASASWFPPELLPFKFDDEGAPTATSAAQEETEEQCAAWLAEAAAASPTGAPALLRDRHVGYLLRSLDGLSSSHASLDASRPWLVYWALQSLDLLGVRPVERFPGVVAFLRRCQCASGGFGGGPGQAAHTAATYAAVLALAVVGTTDAYGAIDRAALLRFYRSVKARPGGAGSGTSGGAAAAGFRVQPDGEMDVRGTYTALAVCTLTRLLDADPGLGDGCAAFLAGCQGYEGGFGGEPGNEAHGGYTYCAVAALHLLQAQAQAQARAKRRGDGSVGDGGGDAAATGAVPYDVAALTRWLVGRQMALEGGFQGRTNKLVDACYSFWQAAVFALLPPARVTRRPAPGSDVAAGSGDGGAPAPQAAAAAVDDDMLLDRRRLQSYLLACCQAPDGGLRDKPGKGRDLYHTCYALGGLAVAQHDRHGGPVPAYVLGGAPNAVAATHPLFNLRPERVDAIRAYFDGAPL
jgi:protein farnesyltransferase subunit beta